MALGVLREYFAGSIEMCVFADASEDVENFPTVRLGILHAIRGQDRQSIMRGKIDKLPVDAFLAAKKMSLKFDENILAAERVDKKLRTVRGVLGSTGC